MNRQSSHSMQVVKREEKDARLTQFVLGEIASGRVSLDGEWCIVALTMESPVVSALARVINDLGGAPQLSVRLVLTRPVVTSPISRPIPGFDNVGALQVRTVGRTALLDAHEQLWLSDVSSWTGDCMRRDPRERDAFEMFADNSALHAGWARKCFWRFWDVAQPVRGSKAIDNILVGENVMAGDITQVDGLDKSVVAATSRH